MKLVRFGPPGGERPGLIDATGTVRDLSGIVPDIHGATLAGSTLADLRRLDPAQLPAVPAAVRLGPPVGRVGKIVGIGLNYADHAREAGLPIPTEPVVFLKASSAITGPNDPIVLPPASEKTDWEIELVAVIGRPTRYVGPDDARDSIAGYCIGIDLSERHWQLERGGQWSKGKSFDTFAPIGPWLVTTDELGRPDALAMELAIDGRPCQRSSTAQMITGVAELVSYVSHIMSLQPGDIVFTGTPAGVGMGLIPPRFLRRGECLTASIDRLGCQRHLVS